MPPPQYAALTDTVLHYKRTHQLGRFDPSAPTPPQLAAQRRDRDVAVIESRGIRVGMRCRVAANDDEAPRRGEVAFVGEVEGLGGERARGAWWVGVRLDEPVGRNGGAVLVEDGDAKKRSVRLFECAGPRFGVVVRPEKVEVGEEWGPLDDLLDGGDDEEVEL